ncbi:hypothetical protein MKW98_019423 [Papaver atlanticum]|uniref:Uncharacterized protein n=1 Tax=Papaver atlanticum TaxID=357466 RepID=A0AAD4X9I9_9MAGN|nr:hypothetical protein MKW98_019423 [Papaver atlanticum]
MYSNWLDQHKIVLNTMVSILSVYCERKFGVGPVEVICSNGESCVFPTCRIGVSVDASQVTSLLTKMQLRE